jgi:hypothetical protein
MAVCWVNDVMVLVMPLFLGTTSETDDSWRGGLRAVLVTTLVRWPLTRGSGGDTTIYFFTPGRVNHWPIIRAIWSESDSS